MPTVLVTGGAGRIGSYLRTGLPRLGWRLRVLDVATTTPDDRVEVVRGDITDAAVVERAVEGVDAIVHLAGVMRADAMFDEIEHANVRGTYVLLDAAQRAGVKKLVFASTNHVNGFSPIGVAGPERPDSYYGVSKLFGEALCRLYVDRFGMSISCLRIGSCFDKPRNPRMLGTWLSPGDAVRLVHTCLVADYEYVVLYGSSANTRNWWDIGPARELGYRPEDNAEEFAEDILAPFGGVDPTPRDAPQGGDAAWRVSSALSDGRSGPAAAPG